MLRSAVLLSIIAISGCMGLSGCGPSVQDEATQAGSACDPWAEVCSLTMEPVSSAVGIDLAQARTMEEAPEDESGMDDVRCWLGRYLVLQAPQPDSLCLLPGTYGALADVEVAPEACECDALEGCWEPVVYFGLANTPPGAFVGRAVLAKTEEGDLYRIRVLHDDSSLETPTLSIEYEGVM